MNNTNNITTEFVENLERNKKTQLPKLEAYAQTLQERFEISGLAPNDLSRIIDRSYNGLDWGINPSFTFDDNGTYFQEGYTFTRADKKEDIRTLLQKLRRQTNTRFTNYIWANVSYGPWQRPHFCGDGINIQIISEEHETIGKVGESKPLVRFVHYGDTLKRDTPKDELLRLCFEFALQRYTKNSNVRVKLNK